MYFNSQTPGENNNSWNSYDTVCVLRCDKKDPVWVCTCVPNVFIVHHPADVFKDLRNLLSGVLQNVQYVIDGAKHKE